MLIPYNTDAPIYHPPITTVGLIVANVLIYFLTTATVQYEFEAENFTWLMLEPDIINPLQWITTNFMHADIMHLVGNMFFLWGFGLVVEGKLGWWRFLSVYMLIGVTYGAIIQLLLYMTGTPTYVLGASAAIFGLMGLAIVWAPKNDLSCLLFISFWVKTVEVPIYVFSMLYLVFQLLPLLFFGFQISSEFLHLTGLGLGVPIGILMLRWDWVDCERWDLFNVIQGTNTRTYTESTIDAKQLLERSKKRREQQAKAAQASFSSKPVAKQSDDTNHNHTLKPSLTASSIERAVLEDNVRVAIALFDRELKATPDFHLPPKTAMQLINALHNAKLYRESIPVMRTLVESQPQQTISVRIKLAKILLQVANEPRKAISVLQSANKLLVGDARSQAKKIISAAKARL